MATAAKDSAREIFYANAARFLHAVSGRGELPPIALCEVDEESMNRLLSVVLVETPLGIAKLLRANKAPTSETSALVKDSSIPTVRASALGPPPLL